MSIKLLLFNKPHGVASQFTDLDDAPGLGRYLYGPGMRDLYPAGRLDKDSEGLIVLTNHGPLQHYLTHPKHKLEKHYLAQVEGHASIDCEQKFATGLTLKDGPTLPAKLSQIAAPNWLWKRDPPIRYRKNDHTCWLQVALREGRNRQVRRMTAAVNLPTLRLIRYGFGNLSLYDDKYVNLRQPGSYAFIDPETLDRTYTPEFLADGNPGMHKNTSTKRRTTKAARSPRTARTYHDQKT